MRMIRLLYVEAGRGRRCGGGVKKSLVDVALQKVEDFLLHVVSAECTVVLPPPFPISLQRKHTRPCKHSTGPRKPTNARGRG